VEQLDLAARHSRPGHAAARRRQRGGRGLPLHHATAPPAGRAGAVAPAAADLDRSKYAPASGVARGAYVLATRRAESRGHPHRTGSEVSLAVEAHEKLLAEGIRSRVVSMPSWDIFEHHQPQEYRDSVLPPAVKARVASSRPPPSDGSATWAPAGHRHEHLRSLGAAQGTAKKVRLRAASMGSRCTAFRGPCWEVTEAKQGSRSDLLAVFPFCHWLGMTATAWPNSLTLETALVAGADCPVPVCFGFHPYFGLPDLPRAEWQLKLPAMRKLVLDQHGVPTGEEELFGGFDSQLGEIGFDDGFALLGERPSFSLAGAGRRITVKLLAGYRYAQVFAPKDKDYVALEPMTAPANALVSGRGLKLVEPGRRFRAAFQICVDSIP
jgi:hypothetical protein